MSSSSKVPLTSTKRVGDASTDFVNNNVSHSASGGSAPSLMDDVTLQQVLGDELESSSDTLSPSITTVSRTVSMHRSASSLRSGATLHTRDHSFSDNPFHLPLEEEPAFKNKEIRLATFAVAFSYCKMQ